MKKILLTITVLFVTLLTMAQAPQLLNFQGVARNAVGNVIPNQLIGVRLSVLSGGPAGTLVYQECRNVFTNAFGLFVVVMGSPGTLCQTGTIAGVNWSGLPSSPASKYLQVEIDPNGGTNFVSVGSTQMVSVPYALNAGGAGPIGPAGGDLTGTYPNPQILIPLIKSQSVPGGPMISMTNTAATGPNGAYFGSSASTDANTAAVLGSLTATSPGSAGGAGVKGTNASTNANGAGVIGTQAGSGMGVLGQAASGSGVRGESGGAGAGVYGLSASGNGVYGTSNTGVAGFFENTNAANTSNTVTANSNSVGNAVSGVNTGTGRGGFFQVNNAASTASAVEATTNGTGASWGGRFTSTGTNGAGLFVQSNATNTANNVQSNQAGLGTAGLFQTTNTANTADALLATTNTTSTTPAAVHGTAGTSGISAVAKKGTWGDTDTGIGAYGTSSSSIGVAGTTSTGTGVSAFSFTTGTALSATSLTGVTASFLSPAGNTNTVVTATTAGTGVTGAFDNSNAANGSNTLQITNANAATGAINPTTGGGEGIFVRKGAALGSYLTNPAGVYATSSDAAGIGLASLTNVNIATFGGTIGVGAGVYGATFGTGGTALVGNGLSSATSYGLVTGGKVQIQGQGAGINKVLTSDAVGNATWNALSTVGGVSGTGTLNYVAKWTPNGTTLGNSQIYDDGTNVGIGTGSPNGKLDVANGSATVRGAQIINSSTTNPSSTIFAQNNSVGGTDPVESAAMTGLFSPILVATPILSGPSAIKGIASPTATVGFAGGMGVQGASGNGVGVAGVSNNGTGVYAYGVGGTSYALQTLGRVQIQGQGAGAGKVLSSDATGNATWNTASSLNIVSGNGTVNLVPKWTPDGNTLGNSQIRDDGTRISLGLAFNDPNSVNIYPMSVNTPNSSLQIGTASRAFGIWTEDATGKAYVTVNNFNVVSGTKIMTFDNSGIQGVGIGTTTPSARLHSVGTHNITYAVPTVVAAASSVVAEQNGSASLEAGIQAYANGGAGENYGVFGVSGGSASSNYGGLFLSQAASGGTNVGILARASGGVTNKAAILQGTVQISDGTQGNGFVFTSDASGNGSWQDLITKNVGIGLQFLTGNVVIPPATFIPVTQWNTINYETNGANYNNVTGEYTITVAGVYQVNASLAFSPAGNDAIDIILNNNGSTLSESTEYVQNTGFTYGMNINVLRKLAVGDKLSITAGHNGAGTATLIAAFASNNFSVQLVKKN